MKNLKKLYILKFMELIEDNDINKHVLDCNKWEENFKYDLSDINKQGIYLHLMFNLNLNTIPNKYIEAKFGKTVTQTIGERNKTHASLNPNNRLIFAMHAMDPTKAENTFKYHAIKNGWYKKGMYSNGKNGREFIAFLPEEALKVKECLYTACKDTYVNEDNKVECEDIDNIAK